MKKHELVIVFALVLGSCREKAEKHQAETSAHKDHSGSTAANRYNGIMDYADSVNTGLIAKDTMKSSPHRTAMANIGKAHIHIKYSSPGMKERIIWGGLVPFETVWVTGAHEATTINFSKDVQIMGKSIKAGSYAFFTIPGKNKWIAILNSRYEQHLADEYAEKEDVARFELIPAHSQNIVQRLNYSVVRLNDTAGTIDVEWEKIRISLPVSYHH